MGLYEYAEAYYEANKDKVDAVVEQLKAENAPDHALDDILHDMAAENEESEDAASSVNNDGFTFQVAAILDGYGEAEGRQRIAEATASALRP